MSGRKKYAIGTMQIVGMPSTRKSRRHFARPGCPEVILLKNEHTDADSTGREFYPYANAPEKLVAKGAAERKMAIRKLFGVSIAC